jgi:hypothetical protein
MNIGVLTGDSGTISGNWESVPGRNVMRAGQKVTIFNVFWTFTGKQGALTIRERTEWVAVELGEDSVALGTWKVVRGTGQYAGITGSGGSGHAGLGTPWYARYEGFPTLP